VLFCIVENHVLLSTKLGYNPLSAFGGCFQSELEFHIGNLCNKGFHYKLPTVVFKERRVSFVLFIGLKEPFMLITPQQKEQVWLLLECMKLRLVCWIAALRRNEAAAWLQKTVGGKDMPGEPTEEHFRIALRSGIVLCNALNNIQPGAVPKVYMYVCSVSWNWNLDSSSVLWASFIYACPSHRLSISLWQMKMIKPVLLMLGSRSPQRQCYYSWWGSSVCLSMLWKCKEFSSNCGGNGASHIWSFWFGTGEAEKVIHFHSLLW